MASTLRVGSRFHGPPGSGNGGYVAGMLAREMGSFGCAVSLKAPPPLDQDMRIERDEAGPSLWAADRLIAQATHAKIDIAVPAPPDLATARAAEARFTGFRDHLFPSCFVCGPERKAGDGLRIFPGQVDGSGGRLVAASWSPAAGLGDEQGEVLPEFIWAALDCPGYFAVQAVAGPAVLGRLAAALHRPPVVDQPLVVTGWGIESAGRKHRVGTAMHDGRGRLMAVAEGMWISINAPDWKG